MKLKQPTIFMNTEEVLEASKFGYIDKCYEHYSFYLCPVIFLLEHGVTYHQPISLLQKSAIRIIQGSVLWADIREKYKPKKWYEGDFKTRHPNGVLCNVKMYPPDPPVRRIIMDYISFKELPFRAQALRAFDPFTEGWAIADPVPPDEAPEILGEEASHA